MRKGFPQEVTIIFSRIRSSSIPVILAAALWWMAFANFSFFRALLADYPFAQNAGFVASVVAGFTGTLVLGLLLLCHRYTLKPLLIFLLIGSSFAAYFMDTYHVLIDWGMIRNVLHTDGREMRDLLSMKLGVYVLALGVLPAALLWRAEVQYRPFWRECLLRLKIGGAILLGVAALFFLSSAEYSSFFREHKTIRYYFNPANYVFATGKLIQHAWRAENRSVQEIGKDAAIPASDVHRELVIMVVGETARADHFSLNGYARETNPRLKQQRIVNFTHVTSCGTSTAISVPCMFSNLNAEDFDSDRAKYTENALDVLHHAGVNILWRDNNSSSKNVADRVEYQDYRDPKVNPVCDEECRDEGMLVGLQDYIDAHPTGDILIVLHAMGNHGPAYYKRYPKAFEQFTPVCHTNELSDCSPQELNNAYDNAILYTDYVLDKTIELLKANDEKFETMMFYVSDHGESLGENGLYLHGMPNFVAPESQRHVPMIMWIGKNFDEISYEALKAKADQPFSHDNIFHTLLELMEVQSTVFDPKMSLLAGAEHAD